MSKSKATTKKREEDAAMDDVLRKMLATKPHPFTAPSTPKRTPKAKKSARRQRNK